MKKIISFSALAGAVVMLSACGAPTQQEQVQEQVQNQMQNQVQEKVQQVKEGVEETVTGTMKDLMLKGQKQKCTWETPEAKGVVYIDKNKVKTEITMLKAEQGPTKVYSIDDGQWLYTWNDAMPTGTKMKSDMLDEAMDETTDKVEGMDIEEEVDEPMEMMDKEMSYKCVKWTGGASEFTPPKNIKFQDMSEMMQGMPNMQQGNIEMKGNGEGVNEMIKACDLAPSPEEKAKCLEGMEQMKEHVQKGIPQ